MKTPLILATGAVALLLAIIAPPKCQSPVYAGGMLIVGCVAY